MDMLRDRLAKYKFADNSERYVVNDFLKPIVLMGKEAERDVNRMMNESMVEAEEASKDEAKELEYWDKILSELDNKDKQHKVKLHKVKTNGKKINKRKTKTDAKKGKKSKKASKVKSRGKGNLRSKRI